MSFSCKHKARTALSAGLICTLALGGVSAITLPAHVALADIMVSDQPNSNIGTSPAATLSDPSTDAGQAVVNNIYHTAQDLFEMNTDGSQVWNTTASGEGSWTMYLSARGTNGQMYYSWGGKTDTETRSIVDMGNVDPTTIEMHFIYKNGPKQSEGGLLFFVGMKEWPLIAYDSSRDITIKSTSGTTYSPALTSSNWDGNYFQPQQYKEKYGSFDNVAGVYLSHRYNMGTAPIKANDVIEVTIPAKFTGYISSFNDSCGMVGFWDATTGSWGTRSRQFLYPAHRHYQWDKLNRFELTPSFYNPESGKWEHQSQLDFAIPSFEPTSKDLQNILHFNFVDVGNNVMVGYSEQDLRLQGYKPATKEFNHTLPSIYDVHQLRVDLPTIEQKLTQAGWTVEFRGTSTQDSRPAYFYQYDRETPVDSPYDVASQTTYQRHLSVIPALIVSAAQHYKVGELPQEWKVSSLLDHVYKADEPLKAGVRAESLETAVHLKEYDKDAEIKDRTIKVSYEYRGAGESDDKFVETDKVDGNKAGVYKVTFTRQYGGSKTPISTFQYVYIDDIKTEVKPVTRTINVHQPDGKTSTIVQKVNLTITTTTDAETGKSASDWKADNSWEAYSAPEVDGWTASKSLDAQDVDADTKNVTEDIFYYRPISDSKTITRTIHVHQPDGTTKDVKQEVQLTRDGTETTTTKSKTNTTWDEWSMASWESFTAPEIGGYRADKSVSKQNVNITTKDTEVDIHYIQLEYKAQSPNPTTRIKIQQLIGMAALRLRKTTKLSPLVRQVIPRREMLQLQ